MCPAQCRPRLSVFGLRAHQKGSVSRFQITVGKDSRKSASLRAIIHEVGQVALQSRGEFPMTVAQRWIQHSVGQGVNESSECREGGRYLFWSMSLRRKLTRVRTTQISATVPNTLWAKLIRLSPRKVRPLRTSFRGVKITLVRKIVKLRADIIH